MANETLELPDPKLGLSLIKWKDILSPEEYDEMKKKKHVYCIKRSEAKNPEKYRKIRSSWYIKRKEEAQRKEEIESGNYTEDELVDVLYLKKPKAWIYVIDEIKNEIPNNLPNEIPDEVDLRAFYLEVREYDIDQYFSCFFENIQEDVHLTGKLIEQHLLDDIEDLDHTDWKSTFGFRSRDMWVQLYRFSKSIQESHKYSYDIIEMTENGPCTIDELIRWDFIYRMSYFFSYMYSRGASYDTFMKKLSNKDRRGVRTDTEMKLFIDAADNDELREQLIIWIKYIIYCASNLHLYFCELEMILPVDPKDVEEEFHRCFCPQTKSAYKA